VNQIERDKKAYELAKKYLLKLGVEGVTPELLEKYLSLSEIRPRPDSIAGVYQRLLESAQNANMRAGVVGGAIGGVDKLGAVLFKFDPVSVMEKYTAGWEQVLDEIEEHLKPRGKIRRAPRSIWPRYCRTIISGARFLAQFATADDFYSWVDFFDQDDRARPALPMLLSHEIYGFGFPLACDFLKELGYVNFAKPDVHLKKIFRGLELCPEKAKDYQVFNAIVRVAKHAGVAPYSVDKLFWLIGSGYFYDDKHIGRRGRIGSHREEFIAYARKKLNLERSAG
jgi:thermostable 8-oxoguanine DNA glycosylase